MLRLDFVSIQYLWCFSPDFLPGFIYPAIANEIAPYLSTMIQTVLIVHTDSRAADGEYDANDALAAYAGVTGTMSFATGLVNFLLVVIMAKAMGSRNWHSVGQRVRLAFLLALGLDLIFTFELMSTRGPVFDLLFHLEDSTRDEAMAPYVCPLPTLKRTYPWRLPSIMCEIASSSR